MLPSFINLMSEFFPSGNIIYLLVTPKGVATPNSLLFMIKNQVLNGCWTISGTKRGNTCSLMIIRNKTLASSDPGSVFRMLPYSAPCSVIFPFYKKQPVSVAINAYKQLKCFISSIEVSVHDCISCWRILIKSLFVTSQKDKMACSSTLSHKKTKKLKGSHILGLHIWCFECLDNMTYMCKTFFYKLQDQDPHFSKSQLAHYVIFFFNMDFNVNLFNYLN